MCFIISSIIYHRGCHDVSGLFERNFFISLGEYEGSKRPVLDLFGDIIYNLHYLVYMIKVFSSNQDNVAAVRRLVSLYLTLVNEW